MQVFPREDLSDDRTLARFVAAVRAVEPAATGLPVNIVEFGRATSDSLREASLLALAAIALLLFLLWRRPLDVVLVLIPLCLAGATTVGIMVLLDMPFNFANVIVLPLLLGIGVDSGIHLVERARHHDLAKDGLADSTTARAILYSALTTLVSFSNLAFSGHRGIASLGVAALVGLTATLALHPGRAARAARAPARPAGAADASRRGARVLRRGPRARPRGGRGGGGAAGPRAGAPRGPDALGPAPRDAGVASRTSTARAPTCASR